MQVEILASSITDNFFYLLCDAQGRAVLVDPVDGERAVEFVRAKGMHVESVVNTHFHHDHIGGNDVVFQAFPEATLLAGALDAAPIEGAQARAVDRKLYAGDAVAVGSYQVRVLDTPGHTAGHISLLGERHLFSGDTIFAGGVGNCRFGGDAGVLYQTFRDVVSALSDAVIFYPGHDYALRNLEFILMLEPGNPSVKALLDQERARVEAAKQAQVAPKDRVLHRRTLGEERAYNPFLRVDDLRFRDGLKAAHPQVYAAELQRSQTPAEAAFRTLRTLRNDW